MFKYQSVQSQSLKGSVLLLTDSRLVIVEAQVPFQDNPCTICDKQSDNGTVYFLLIFLQQSQSLIVTYMLLLPVG